MTGEYQVLKPIDAIRIRPGMYIGDVENPKHLITEVIDNSLDEISNKLATECHIYYQDNTWWVMDNGRGIKVYDMKLESGAIQDSVVTLCTDLHSGSKFDTNSYNTLIGMHGVGLVVVNALSEWLTIRTRDRKDKTKIYTYNFIDGELANKNIEENHESWSTQVGFKPNISHFRNGEFDITPIVERLLLVQAKFPNTTISFNNQELPKRNFEEYVKNILKVTDDVTLIKYDKSINEKLIIAITYNQDANTVMAGDVNLRLCDGKYLTYFQSLLKECINDNLDRKFKDVPENLLLLGLKLYISMTIPEPQFSSQEKNVMTLPVKHLIDPLKAQINNFIKKPGILDIIQHNIEVRMNQKIVKTSKTRSVRISADNKLKDCDKIPGDILYILEGDSALGTLKQVRDTDTEAIFPLKGKIINVENASFDKLHANKEIKDLNEALGPKGNRRYKKIKLICDADMDGHHIIVLTLLTLMKFAVDFIQSGNVSVIFPPLFGAEKGKVYVPIYKIEEVEKYRSQGYSIMRFKGLGEMSPKKLEVSIRGGCEYIVKPPSNLQELNGLKAIISEAPIKRAILNDERCSFERVLLEIGHGQPTNSF